MRGGRQSSLIFIFLLLVIREHMWPRSSDAVVIELVLSTVFKGMFWGESSCSKLGCTVARCIESIML